MSTLTLDTRAEVERAKGEIRVNGILYTASVIVRHHKACEDRAKGASYPKCQCWKTLLVYDGAAKKQRMVAAQARSWARAEAKAEEWLDQFDPTKKTQAAEAARTKTIEEAIAAFISVKKGKWASGTLERKRTMWGHGDHRKGSFLNWVDTLSPRPVLISEITTAQLDAWRAAQDFDSDLSLNSAITDVKSFFKFCKTRGLVQSNPADEIERPSIAKGNRTTAFSDSEYEAILEAAKATDDQRLVTFLELMRWSGMDLMDASQYQPSQLKGDVLTYRRCKTGNLAVPILPAHVIAMLRSVPLVSDSVGPEMPFRTKGAAPESDSNKWWRRLKAVFEAAGIDSVKTDFGPRAPHPKMLRDTFAVGKIRARVPLIHVSRMLGHSNTKITEKHYLPFILEMQEVHNEAGREGVAAEMAKLEAKAKGGKVVRITKSA
jgi:integrase